MPSTTHRTFNIKKPYQKVKFFKKVINNYFFCFFLPHLPHGFFGDFLILPKFISIIFFLFLLKKLISININILIEQTVLIIDQLLFIPNVMGLKYDIIGVINEKSTQ